MASPDWTRLRIELLGEHPQSLLPPRIKLPMLPRAVTEFSQKAADPDASPKELGALIESDAGLTCELLKHVNSSTFALRKRVSTAQQAIALLGIRNAKLFVCSTAVRQAMTSRDSKLINLQSFWNVNLERALLAREIARLLNADAELAFAGTLLQDVALPVLSSELLDAYVAFSSRQDGADVELATLETERFGWNHAEAAAQVMTGWKLPDDLVCCVALHHRGLRILTDPTFGRTAAAAGAIAALMPDPLRQSPTGLQQLVRLEGAWPKFDLLAIARRVQEGFESLASSPSPQHIPFLRRCESLLEAKAT